MQIDPNQDKSRPAEESQVESAVAEEAPRFIQYLFFKLDPAWRRLSEGERTKGRQEFARVVEQTTAVQTFSYSTLGLKIDSDLMLWRTANSLDELQEMLAQLLQTGLGL